MLRQKIEFLGRAIDMLADELDNDRLSPEAREDPEILADAHRAAGAQGAPNAVAAGRASAGSLSRR